MTIQSHISTPGWGEPWHPVTNQDMSSGIERHIVIRSQQWSMKKERINLAPYRLPPSGTGWSHQSCSCKQECVASCKTRVKLRTWFLPELHVPPWTFRPPRLPVGCLWPRVPRRCQRRVDDHVHRNQVGHGVIGSPHCAQDPFTGLLKVQRQLISDGRSGFRAFRCREQVRGRREEQRSTLASAPVCASLVKCAACHEYTWQN